MWIHEFRPDRPEYLVLAVLDQAQLAGVEHHAHVGVLKVEPTEVLRK